MALSPRARALLAKHKVIEGLPPQARGRVFETLMQHADAPAPLPRLDVDPGAFRLLPQDAAPIAKATGGLATKLLVTLAVAGVAGGAWWHERATVPTTVSASVPVTASTLRSIPSSPSPAHAAPLSPASEGGDRSEPPLVRLSDLPRVAPRSSVSSPGTAPSTRSVSTDRAPQTQRGPEEAPESTALPSGPTLEREATSNPAPAARPDVSASARTTPDAPAAPDEDVELLTNANRALAAGDTGRAIALVEEHRARFPQSVLAPAREATGAIALCQSGQASRGADAARAFLRAYPGSAFAARVRSACRVP
jgi:hypothetical protein